MPTSITKNLIIIQHQYVTQNTKRGMAIAFINTSTAFTNPTHGQVNSFKHKH